MARKRPKAPVNWTYLTSSSDDEDKESNAPIEPNDDLKKTRSSKKTKKKMKPNASTKDNRPSVDPPVATGTPATRAAEKDTSLEVQSPEKDPSNDDHRHKTL